MSEHDEQVAVIDWARWHIDRYPALRYLFSIPNGAKLPYKKAIRGGRAISISPQRTKLLKEGLKSGVSDLSIAVRRGGYAGLWLELKHGDNEPTKEQYLWLAGMLEEGYYADWCAGSETAIKIIEWYLSLEKWTNVKGR